MCGWDELAISIKLNVRPKHTDLLKVFLLVTVKAQILEVVPVQGHAWVVDVVGCDVVLVMHYVARLDDAALQASLTQSAHAVDVCGSCVAPRLAVIERFAYLSRYHRYR